MTLTVELPTIEEIRALGGRDLDRALVALDEHSCGTSALIAAVVDRAEQTGHYLVDGHRSARAWAQATCNWSRAVALTHLRVARLVRGNEQIGPELAEGRLGVPQVAELARLYANPPLWPSAGRGHRRAPGGGAHDALRRLRRALPALGGPGRRGRRPPGPPHRP